MRPGEKARSAAAVAALHLGAGYLLLSGLSVVPAAERQAPLKLIDLPQPVPPPAPPPPRAERRLEKRPQAREAEGSPAPDPVPVVAPVPEVVLPVTTLVAAPVPGRGADERAGAGTGGSGTGSGRAGTGSGGGGGGGITRARLLSGRLVDRDYPRSASRAGAGGTVIVRFAVGIDGRASGCRVTRSSGHPELDATTCRLIEQRFLYAPARDGEGRAVADVMGWKQDWWLERRGD